MHCSNMRAASFSKPSHETFNELYSALTPRLSIRSLQILSDAFHKIALKWLQILPLHLSIEQCNAFANLGQNIWQLE